MSAVTPIAAKRRSDWIGRKVPIADIHAAQRPGCPSFSVLRMSFPDLDQNGVRLLCEPLSNDMGCFSMIQKSALSLCILMALIGPSQSISNGASVSEDDPISW